MMRAVNVFFGTLVVEVGFWLLWGGGSPIILLAWALIVGSWLWWRALTVTQVWAWSTLLLGLESFAWPVLLMIQLKGSPVAPSEEEMGTILSAVVLGLFSSVFWISFSYGLFKRRGGLVTAAPTNPSPPGKQPASKRQINH